MNTKKLALALFPLLLAFASCMNIDGSSGKEGAIRVTLPESGSRGIYTLSKDNPLYEVSLMQGDKTLKTLSSESTGGGDFVFDELEPGTYKIVVTARQQDGTFLARNSAEVEVTAGETQNCPITLILAGNKGKVFSSDYYVLTNSSGYTDFVNSVDSTTSMSSTQARLGAEDINGTQFSVRKSGGSSFEFYIFKNESSAATVAISQSGIAAIDDYIYYDTINDSLWVGAYSSSGFYFANNINKLFYEDGSQPGSITLNTPCTLSGLSIYPNAQYTAFAASGTELYIAYTNNGTSYLQRAKIEGENDSFTITKIGNPQSTQDMGVDGQITDIVIHYDGYVYVLVSQMGYSYTSGFSQNSFSLTPGDINYSRGAIVRLEPTSNGFKVSAKTGWTENYRTVYTKGTDPHPNSTFETNIKKLEEFRETKVGLKLYIPKYSERNSYFYGPRRFVAIKPKELAIADSGANIMLPEYPKTGGFFKHNRVVNVNLYKFAIESNSIIDLNNILFAPIYTLTDVGFTSQGYTSSTEADE
ncbi:carboxypeptidase-like regulatory domain-containing protein [uncultured Treponema sp.]|uniref:carboxypeptidase-like regulatory domain-containing protein n=1 Tax=uncultured Treponema sp. TaxID=162155 RepID=UPI002586E046|nr:carboxypeptidase-like regulatory domain-containing protein [uncultured Treponema sp.]